MIRQELKFNYFNPKNRQTTKEIYIFNDFFKNVQVAKRQINISELIQVHLRQIQNYIPNEIEKTFYDSLLKIKNTPQSSTVSEENDPFFNLVLKYF